MKEKKRIRYYLFLYWFILYNTGFVCVLLFIGPIANKLETGNRQADETDSHQGQPAKPLLDFQVSLRENTRGWVKPGKGWWGVGGMRWRIWNWMTDVTWLLVNYPAGAPLCAEWETCCWLDYQFEKCRTLLKYIVSLEAGWHRKRLCLWRHSKSSFRVLFATELCRPDTVWNVFP